VIYGYDSAGNQTSITYPGQTTAVAQTFDADNRLASVTDFSGNKTAFGYTQDSRLATTIYPDGVTVTNDYDTTDTLTSTNVAKGTEVYQGSWTGTPDSWLPCSAHASGPAARGVSNALPPAVGERTTGRALRTGTRGDGRADELSVTSRGGRRYQSPGSTRPVR
jgi:YD repeat-containing protein